MYKAYYLPKILLALVCLSLLSCGSSPKLKEARMAKEAGRLEEAFNHYYEHLQKDSGSSEAKEQVRSIGAILAKKRTAALRTTLNETKGLSVPQLQSNIASIKEVSKYDPEGKIFPALIAEIEQRISTIEEKSVETAKLVRMAIRMDDLAQARRYFKDITSKDPKSKVLKDLEPEFLALYSKYLNATFKKYLIDGNIELAQEELVKVQSCGLSEHGIEQLSGVFQAQMHQGFKEKIQKDIKARRYYSAYLTIITGELEEELANELNKIKSQGAPFYLRQAKARLSKKQYDRAYLEAVKGYELNSSLSGMFETHRDTRDKIIKSLQRYIAISAFGAPNKNPDLGPQFSDALISYLFRVLPYGVNILERQKIDLIMQEKKRELKKISDVLNVDLIVTGNVSLMEIDRQVSEQQATVRAKVGETQQVNPAYQEWERRKRGDAPPRTYAVPIHDNVQYKKGRVVLKGFATVSARIFDAKKGSITYAQEFNARYDASDEFQHEVPGSNIEEDPLDLPSETEINEILRNKIIQQLSDVIQAEFAKRKTQFIDDVEYFIARKEVNKAMQPMAQGFLYNIKSKIPVNDPDFKKLRDLIVEYSEKNFL